MEVRGKIVRSTYNFTLETYQLLIEDERGNAWKLQGPGEIENLAFVRDEDSIIAVVYRGDHSEWLDIRSITYH